MSDPIATTVPQMDLEKAAAIQHDAWAAWMGYLFSRCKKTGSGDVVIPAVWVDRWTRQVDTSYADLSEKDKQGNRDVINILFI